MRIFLGKWLVCGEILAWFNPWRRDFKIWIDVRNTLSLSHTRARSQPPRAFVDLAGHQRAGMGPMNRSADASPVGGGAEGVVLQRKPAEPPEQRHETAASPSPATQTSAAVVHTRSVPERPLTAVSTSAVEWGDLVTTLRTLHLGRQQAQACTAPRRRSRPKVCTHHTQILEAI